MHILSADQLEPSFLSELLVESLEMQEARASLESRQELSTRHTGKQICTLFYEPSTRTRLSFELAALKLGAGVISTEAAGMFSSVTKGETLEDTIRVLNEYNTAEDNSLGVIVLRHPETGSAKRAASVSEIPIINGGDGKGEHPTQALLDMFTIFMHKGRLDNLNVVIGGDLKRGRTARSVAQILANYPNNRISFVSTSELQIGDDIKAKLDTNNTEHQETTDMYSALETADVVYWTRLQKERSEGEDEDSSRFVLDEKALEVMPAGAIILHPLPRVNEIATIVDTDPRAVYFKQSGYGLPTRMALIDRLLRTS